jgi:hypothetical protein
MYDDTSGLLEKEGDALIWGNVYQMFKKKKLSIDVRDQDVLKIFKNISRSRIFRLAMHDDVLPYTDAITWILKHIYLGNIYVYNSRREPIASFHHKDLAKGYHLDKGTKNMDN